VDASEHANETTLKGHQSRALI